MSVEDDATALIMEIADACHAMSNWRVCLSIDFPHDARNLLAVQQLDKLANELTRTDIPTQLKARLGGAWANVPPSYKDGPRNLLNEHLRLVGFYAHPENAQELLQWMVNNLGKTYSLLINQPETEESE
jgi:hypothetical protein